MKYRTILLFFLHAVFHKHFVPARIHFYDPVHLLNIEEWTCQECGWVGYRRTI
jgi:hypothetical protein